MGAAWYQAPRFLARGFYSDFSFRSLEELPLADTRLPAARSQCAAEGAVGGGGIALVVHSDLRGTEAIGCPGSGLGFAADLSYASTCSAGIDQSLSVSVHTHPNATAGSARRIEAGEVRVARGVGRGHLVSARLRPGLRLDDGEAHRVRVQYTCVA